MSTVSSPSGPKGMAQVEPGVPIPYSESSVSPEKVGRLGFASDSTRSSGPPAGCCGTERPSIAVDRKSALRFARSWPRLRELAAKRSGSRLSLSNSSQRQRRIWGSGTTQSLATSMRSEYSRLCRVGGGALARWPPSAAQTARTVFPYAAFTKTLVAETKRVDDRVESLSVLVRSTQVASLLRQ
jgi:hypothetical protein